MNNIIKGLSVLVIDDEYGANEEMKHVFRVLLGIDNPEGVSPHPWQIPDVCNIVSGQDKSGNNDLDSIISLVKNRRDQGDDWSLVLLDMHFKSRVQSNTPFGATVYRELKRHFPDLPIVMLTGDEQKDIKKALPETPPYLSKSALGLIGEKLKRYNELAKKLNKAGYDEKKRLKSDQDGLIWENWRNLVIHGFFASKGPTFCKNLTNLQKRGLLCIAENEVAGSDVMLQCFFQVFIAAAPGCQVSPLLLTGETGVGKEVMAKYFHRISFKLLSNPYNNPEYPYKAFEVTTVPTTLFSSNLYGHTRGAFTGACEDAPGYVASAGNGTLFLDEIGDLSLENMNQMRRLLGERTYEKVGGKHALLATCRFVLATNNPEGLKNDIRERMGTEIDIPPLRSRPEDLQALAHYFCGRRNLSIDDEAIAELRNYDFKGNVRELESIINGIVKSESGLISLEDICNRIGRTARTEINTNESKCTDKYSVIYRPWGAGSLQKTNPQLSVCQVENIRHHTEEVKADVPVISPVFMETQPEAAGKRCRTVQEIAKQLDEIELNPGLAGTDPGAMLLLQAAYINLLDRILDEASRLSLDVLKDFKKTAEPRRSAENSSEENNSSAERSNPSISALSYLVGKNLSIPVVRNGKVQPKSGSTHLTTRVRKLREQEDFIDFKQMATPGSQHGMKGNNKKKSGEAVQAAKAANKIKTESGVIENG